uniref:Collagen type XXVIII alpha 1 chain n=1 Tax=Sphenodon punctatus TaxID=8508 RepID=A0A8D0GQQ9_SPHPU
MWKKHSVFCVLLLAVATNPIVYGQNRKKGQRPRKDDLQDACFIDIIFILDSSESAKDILFDKQKEFVNTLSDKIFQMKPSKFQKYVIKQAVMQFSSTVKIDHHFVDWKDLQNFKQEVNKMNYIGHGTYSFYAISNATQLFKTEGRKRSVQVALLMSDGIDHPKSPDVQGISEAARALGISFITIGLSKVANPTKLQLISGDPPGRPVLTLNDSNLSDEILNQLVSNLLRGHHFGEPGPAGPYGPSGVPGIGHQGSKVITNNICPIHKLYLSCCGVKCRDTPLELVFVIDSSESVGPENFDIIKSFIKTVIEMITVSPAVAHVGIINFSHKVEVVSTLQQFMSKDHLKLAVDNMQYLGEGTFTATAIKKAAEIFQVARPGVRKVAIVITDGQTDSRDIKLHIEVKKAHAQNIEMFVIGVVQRSDPNFGNFLKEMKLIATDPDTEHVHQIDDFTLEKNIFQKICENEFDFYLSQVPSSTSALYPGFETTSEHVIDQSGRTHTPQPYIPPPKQEVIDSVSKTFATVVCLHLFKILCLLLILLVERGVFYPNVEDKFKLPFYVFPDPKCLEPMRPGECRDYHVKWYYDKDANACARFWYGGCDGTRNRFETEKECRDMCVHG